MTPRSTTILCTLAGFIAGASLVGGLAFQAGGQAGGQPAGQPGGGDRPPEERRGVNGRPREGQPGRGRPVMDRDRLVRRLEEIGKRLDADKDAVAKLLEALRAGQPMEALDGKIREVLMATAGRGRGEGNNAGGPPEGERLDLLRVVRETDPALADRIEKFQRERPIANMILIHVAPKPQDVLRAHKESPELFTLYRDQISSGLDVADRAFELLELRRTAAPESDEFKAKKTELREAVGRSLDQRARLQEHDLESLIKRVDDLRTRVSGAAAEREKNIDAFVERITRMLDDLPRRGRGPGGGGGPGGPGGDRPEGPPEGPPHPRGDNPRPAGGPPR